MEDDAPRRPYDTGPPADADVPWGVQRGAAPLFKKAREDAEERQRAAEEVEEERERQRQAVLARRRAEAQERERQSAKRIEELRARRDDLRAELESKAEEFHVARLAVQSLSGLDLVLKVGEVRKLHESSVRLAERLAAAGQEVATEEAYHQLHAYDADHPDGGNNLMRTNLEVAATRGTPLGKDRPKSVATLLADVGLASRPRQALEDVIGKVLADEYRWECRERGLGT